MRNIFSLLNNKRRLGGIVGLLIGTILGGVFAFNLTATAKDNLPPLAPLPPPPNPIDNPSTPEKVALGRMLYFDARMSGDGSMSCNSYHPSTTGWGAPTAISFGGPGTSHWRNASTILNTAYYSKLNWDGGKGSIEKQNSGAWGSAVAGNLDSALAEERLAQIARYVERFKKVYGNDYPLWDNALKSLDAYLSGDESAISDAAKRGLELFNGKAGCLNCHNGTLASDDRYYALGVPQNPDFFDSLLKQITFCYEQLAKGAYEKLYRTTTEDLNLYYVTKQEIDQGKFRTPSLRDLCYTGPYMHNGVFNTLEEVVAFYNAGGGNNPNKDPRIVPLDLTADEQADLIEGLNSLCGDRVTDEMPALPPYGEYVIPQDER